MFVANWTDFYLGMPFCSLEMCGRSIFLLNRVFMQIFLLNFYNFDHIMFLALAPMATSAFHNLLCLRIVNLFGVFL